MTVGLYNGQETGPSKVIRVKYGNASFCTNLIKHEWCLVLKIQGINSSSFGFRFQAVIA